MRPGFYVTRGVFHNLTDKIIKRVSERFDAEEIEVSIGTCIMAADTPDKQKSLQDYLNMADQSMYENKRKRGQHKTEGRL